MLRAIVAVSILVLAKYLLVKQLHGMKVQVLVTLILKYVQNANDAWYDRWAKIAAYVQNLSISFLARTRLMKDLRAQNLHVYCKCFSPSPRWTATPPTSCPLEAQEGRGTSWRARGARRKEWSGGNAGCIIYQVIIRVSALCSFHCDISLVEGRPKKQKQKKRNATKQHNGEKDLRRSAVEPREARRMKQTPWLTLALALSFKPTRAFRRAPRTEGETAEASGKSCGTGATA